MTSLNRSSGGTGAKATWSNVISNGATWIESFEISENELEIVGADDSDWRIIIKSCSGGSSALTLSSGSEITVTQNTTSTVFAIECPVSSLTSLSGDYDCDLVQKDEDDNIIHWCSGTITINDETLWVD